MSRRGEFLKGKRRVTLGKSECAKDRKKLIWTNVLTWLGGKKRGMVFFLEEGLL